ncbi:MAG: hypothetical protein AMXMBFR58_34120 [Phycisphaerae bacterium]
MAMTSALGRELRALAATTLYFGVWLGSLIVLKHLILEEDRIEFDRWTAAVVGTLVLAKVVLVLEHVSLGELVRARPAWVEVVAKTALYASGVFAVLVLEHAFEGRHEHGSFGASLSAVFRDADFNHVIVNAMCCTGALLGYNVLMLVRRRLGPGGLRRAFLTPVAEE